jgi:hypothetical protein
VQVYFLATSAVTYPGITHGVRVMRLADGLFLDFDDGEWKAPGVVIALETPATESSAARGVWGANVELPAYTGSVWLLGYSSTGTEPVWLQAAYLVAGESLVDLARPQVALTHNTGGIDALQFLDAEGGPVEGASVRVFRYADYRAGQPSTPLAVTTTDAAGRWVAPVYVNAGGTYTLHFQKDLVAGPVVTSVVV